MFPYFDEITHRTTKTWILAEMLAIIGMCFSLLLKHRNPEISLIQRNDISDFVCWSLLKAGKHINTDLLLQRCKTCIVDNEYHVYESNSVHG